ncbi:hypothetical protein EYF80_020187 [Liparis tanakae]|uniref:Uncharacterized protein n=1 Tax=Liparis tanakae TaxID=230148 RepID=A0A4Z2HX99_9TELE|nr:hypothetical protein EYF80_020187 [Liparis tanakae]
MEAVSSSPGRRLPVSLMDRPKSARTQDRSARTSTLLLVTSRWATAGLYWSEGTEAIFILVWGDRDHLYTVFTGLRAGVSAVGGASVKLALQRSRLQQQNL